MTTGFVRVSNSLSSNSASPQVITMSGYPNYVLSKKQKLWLSFCLSGVLLTNSICWKRFERISLGKFRFSALSWMFRNSKISFDHLLKQSTCNILKHYGIKEGVLCVDDVDRGRSKSTKKIFKVQKLKLTSDTLF